MIVAIDGPAGSGKSTIAKEIARQLGFNKLDTGAMLIHQRRAAEDRDIVAEGRDIGTVVFPNAQVKVFLTADPRERARRRVLQRHQNAAQPLTSEQLEAEVDETLDALRQRDKLDSSREVAPLVPAEDAVHVDSTAHTIDEVVSIIEDLINQRR